MTTSAGRVAERVGFGCCARGTEAVSIEQLMAIPIFQEAHEGDSSWCMEKEKRRERTLEQCGRYHVEGGKSVLTSEMRKSDSSERR